MKKLQLGALIALVALVPAGSFNDSFADDKNDNSTGSLEKNASNALHNLENEADKGGQAIASAVKKAGNKNVTASGEESSQNRSAGTWNQFLNDFGKGFSNAMLSLENWMREVSNRGQTEFVHAEHDAKPYMQQK